AYLGGGWRWLLGVLRAWHPLGRRGGGGGSLAVAPAPSREWYGSRVDRWSCRAYSPSRRWPNQRLHLTPAASRLFGAPAFPAAAAGEPASFGEVPGGRVAEVQEPWPGESDRLLPWAAAGS